MTKNEMMKKYKELTKEKGVKLDGINESCKKEVIQNAIDCLECSDELLDKYLVLIELKYPNMHKIVMKSDFKTHYYNRLLVYNITKRMLEKVEFSEVELVFISNIIDALSIDCDETRDTVKGISNKIEVLLGGK